jgi:hypothetical protein
MKLKEPKSRMREVLVLLIVGYFGENNLSSQPPLHAAFDITALRQLRQTVRKSLFMASTNILQQ